MCDCLPSIDNIMMTLYFSKKNYIEALNHKSELKIGPVKLKRINVSFTLLLFYYV